VVKSEEGGIEGGKIGKKRREKKERKRIGCLVFFWWFCWEEWGVFETNSPGPEHEWGGVLGGKRGMLLNTVKSSRFSNQKQKKAGGPRIVGFPAFAPTVFFSETEEIEVEKKGEWGGGRFLNLLR